MNVPASQLELSVRDKWRPHFAESCMIRLFRSKCAISLACALVVSSCAGLTSAQQQPATAGTEKSVSADYQNHQRARRVLEMESEIRAMPDALVRGHLRLKVLEFVFS